jgi:hypothetical protein
MNSMGVTSAPFFICTDIDSFWRLLQIRYKTDKKLSHLIGKSTPTEGIGWTQNWEFLNGF